MLPTEFSELCKGYENKIIRESGMFRKMAFISVMPYADKGFSFNRFCREFWPLPDDNAAPLMTIDPNLSSEMFMEIIAGRDRVLRQSKREKQNARRSGVRNKNSG